MEVPENIIIILINSNKENILDKVASLVHQVTYHFFSPVSELTRQ